MIIVDFFPSNQFKRKMHQSHNIKRIALQSMGYPIIQARFLDLRSLKITDCEISKTCVPNTLDLTMVERVFLNQVPYPRLQPLDMGLWILPTKNTGNDLNLWHTTGLDSPRISSNRNFSWRKASGVLTEFLMLSAAPSPPEVLGSTHFPVFLTLSSFLYVF